jgi:1,2-dihydroxy-3-keto-5-methylthiopentene dioxygenase
MSRLTIYSEGDPATPLLDTDNGGEIATALTGIGVQFARWPAEAPLAPDADDAAVLAAYARAIAQLRARGGYQAVDVIRLAPDHPDKEVLRG